MRQVKKAVWAIWGLALCLAGFSVLPAAVSAASLPQYRFTRSFDTSGGSALTAATATDTAGNVYMAGYFTGSVNFAGSAGSDVRSAPSGTDAFLTKYKNDGTYLWTKAFDVSAGQASGTGLAVDKQGNSYLVGDFSDTVVFDGPGGSNNITQSPGVQGTFITKYDASGGYAWTRTFDVSAGQTYTSAAVTDSHGNLYVTGSFLGTISPGGSDTFTDPSSNGNIFTAQFSSNGNYMWARAFDSTNGTLGVAMSIAADADDNIYAGGAFSGTMIFDGPGGSDSATDLTGDGNTYITKYDSDGSYKSTKTFDTSPGGYSYGAQGLAVDTAGNLYTVGAISGTVTIGGDTRTANLKGAVTVVKYNTDGSYAWSKTLSDAGGWSDGHGITTDSLGDVYVTGEFYQTVTFDGNNDPHTAAAVGSDTFITKYNPDGSYAWTRTADISPGGLAAGFSLAADNFGNIFAAGFLSGAVIFDGPGGSDLHDGGAGAGSFVTSYAAFEPVPLSAAEKSYKTTVAGGKADVSTESSPASTAEAAQEAAAPTVDSPTPIVHTAAPTAARKHFMWLYLLIAASLFVIVFFVWLRRGGSRRRHQRL